MNLVVSPWIVQVDVIAGKYHVYPKRDAGGEWIPDWRFGFRRTRRRSKLYRLVAKCQKVANDLNDRDAVVADLRARAEKRAVA